MSHPLLRMIAEGEHQQQDFKFRIDDARKIARTLSAFANTDGGRLLVGVKDNGKIVGIRSDEEMYVVESAAQIYCKPEVEFETRLWEINGKQVLEVVIPPSESKPIRAPHEDGRSLAFVRKADQNFLANRVLLKVWKSTKKPRGAGLSWTEPEEKLFAYLREHGEVSISKFRKLAEIKRDQAETILVRLICWDIIEMELTGQATTYRLAPSE